MSEPTSDHPFDSHPLPTRIPGRDVRLTVEQLKAFRDDYDALLAFAAQVCEVDPRELTRDTCDRWMWDNRGIPTFWMQVQAMFDREDSR